MTEIALRSMTEADRSEVAELIYSSINYWYQVHGAPRIFQGGPRVTEIYYDVYNDLTPGKNVVAVNTETGRLMGSCFYHPRERHVSLGIMTVHPNYFGMGVGGRLLKHIIAFTEENGYPALRLTQSAINVDSFSLYNKAGFVPRYSYQDMIITVPESGLDFTTPGQDRVRPATLDDVPQMAELEMEVSGITRELDYAYCIRNVRNIWDVYVSETPDGTLDGFMISCGFPATNLLGPCVTRTEEAALALILNAYNLYPGRSPICLVPMEKQKIVRQMYDWGARNTEMHFCQVRGEFQPFNGVNIPTFMPETG